MVNTVTVSVVGPGDCGRDTLLDTFMCRSDTGFYSVKPVRAANGDTMLIKVWNFPGDLTFDNARESKYMQSDCMVLVFSLTNPNTLAEAIDFWCVELSQKCRDKMCYVVGLQCDDQPLVPEWEVQTLLNKLDCYGGYREGDPRDEEFVGKVFDYIISQERKPKCDTRDTLAVLGDVTNLGPKSAKTRLVPRPGPRRPVSRLSTWMYKDWKRELQNNQPHEWGTSSRGPYNSSHGGSQTTCAPLVPLVIPKVRSSHRNRRCSVM